MKRHDSNPAHQTQQPHPPSLQPAFDVMANGFTDRSVRRSNRWTLIVAVATALVFLTLAAIVLHLNYQSSLDGAEHELQVITSIFSDNVQKILISAENILDSLSDRVLLTDPESPEFTAYMVKIRENTPFLRSMAVLDAEGKGVNDPRGRELVLGMELSDRDYVRVHLTGEHEGLHFSPPLQSRVDGGWFVPVSKAVRNAEGNLIGIVFVSINPLYFRDQLQSLAASIMDRGALLYRDGTLLVRHPFDPSQIGTSFAATSLFRTRLASAPRGIFHAVSPFDGVKQIIAYSTIPAFPLIAVLVINKNRALTNFYRNAAIWSIIIFMMLISIVMAAWKQVRLTSEILTQSRALRASNRALQEAQERMVRQERLAVLGQLAGGIGHELRNPLGVITNALYFLEMTRSQTDDTLKEYLGIISNEVKNADQIVSDLLDYARIKALSKTATSVNELISSILKKHPPDENIDVITEIPDDLPPVHVDPLKIEQVLTNLYLNAQQAMPEGGKVRFTGYSRDGSVTVSVTDTGAGIPAENMDQIFEPLFTTKARGFGFGLAICKNFVNANNGTIAVESREGEGSTFTIVLPKEETAHEKSSEYTDSG